MLRLGRVTVTGQPRMGAVRKPLKSTLALTVSPRPGPAPPGPFAAPHQLPVAVTVAPPPETTAVSLFWTMQLPVMESLFPAVAL